MSSAALLRRYMPEEYLTLERKAEFRHELVDGEIYAMSGASKSHNRIALKMASALDLRLAGRPCEPFVNEMRVYVPKTKLYTYPDVIVVRGEPEFQDGEFDTLLTPTVLVEILSPSTEAYDRGKKFAYFQIIETF